jgi:hypothetical protein
MNQLGNYCSTTTTSFFKNAFSIANRNGGGTTAVATASKYLKYVYIGIVAYSAYSTYHFFRERRKKKQLVKKELPEHIKYDNGWYAELDEIQKMSIIPTVPILSEPPPTIQEVTPRGEILMYYHVDNKAFEYYSNNKNLPYKTLDAVARKYVCTHNVPSIYVDIREEVKKGTDKHFQKLKDGKSVDAAKPTSASSMFAVYKNYKSGTNSSLGNNSNSKNVILKDNVNKFIFKGRIDDYALDVKAREKKKDSSKNEEKDNSDGNGNKNEEINISYSEFKKRNANGER